MKWDFLSFIHYSVLLGKDIKPYLNEFANRPESFMSPQFTTPRGTYIETGMMFMKPSAVKKWILNGSVKEYKHNGIYLTIEQEATLIFNDDWFNPFDDITTIRRDSINTKHDGTNNFLGNYVLTDECFIDLPFIFSLPKHCPPYLVDEWKRKHPIGD